MALLLRKTRQPADTADTPGEDQPAAFTPYTSQAFELWDGESRPQGKRHVLDLGVASGENVAYFGEEPCVLEVAGLTESLPTGIDAGDDDDPDELERRALHDLLPSVPPRSLHGALCWDLVNYMTRSQIIALGAWLGEVLAVDGVVLLSLHTGSRMPPAPSRYRIQGAGSLARLEPEGEPVPCPRYSQGDLKRDWPDFEVLRSYLLRSEAQEFVLRRV